MEPSIHNNKIIMLLSVAFVVLAAVASQRFGLGSGQMLYTSNDDNSLPMDTALINVTSNLGEPLTILGISSNCHKCSLQVLKDNVKESVSLKVETNYLFNLTVKMKDKQLCSYRHHFLEHGYYFVVVHRSQGLHSNQISCNMQREQPYPRNAYLPLLYAFLVLFGLAVSWMLVLFLFRKYRVCTHWKLFEDTESLINADLGSPDFRTRITSNDDQEERTEKSKKKRLKSLDTFRGIALTIMIFVNYGGGGYYFFKHARWDGLTVADLVFPWFMWIMGVSLVLSFQVLRRREVKKMKMFVKIIRRTIILFALGLFVSNRGNLKQYRIPGVLQRFAACYLIVSLLQLLINPSLSAFQPVRAWWNPIRDVIALWGQWLVMLCLLTIYVVVTFALKVPGCPRGYIGPGGLANPKEYNCTGGMAGYIDRQLFGPNHIYRHPTCMKTYDTKVPYDPEGALGTMTSAFLVFLGVQAGYTLFTFPNHVSRMKRWLIWALVLGCAAFGLAGVTNDSVVPLNKNLWSVSFILATGAMAFFLLTFCYVAVDVLRWWNGAPFCYPGMNSILVYVGSEILAEYFPFSWEVSGHMQHPQLLTMNLVGTAVWLIISYYLFCIKFFVKI